MKAWNLSPVAAGRKDCAKCWLRVGSNVFPPLVLAHFVDEGCPWHENMKKRQWCQHLYV